MQRKNAAMKAHACVDNVTRREIASRSEPLAQLRPAATHHAAGYVGTVHILVHYVNARLLNIYRPNAITDVYVATTFSLDLYHLFLLVCMPLRTFLLRVERKIDLVYR